MPQLPAPPPGPDPKKVDFPGGLGRRVTTLDSFLGISGSALLPKTNTSSVNVVLCQGTAGVPGKALADAFEIYLGTIGTIKTDFDLMLGHPGWGGLLLPMDLA